MRGFALRAVAFRWNSLRRLSQEVKISPASSFYRRPLPLDTCVPFLSDEGRAMFAQSLSKGSMECFFPLIEQFRTQDHPTYCGLASLAMVLNALEIDPGRTWKGVWRWFDEEKLDCCKPLDRVMREGVTFSQVVCLARCNGAQVVAANLADRSSEDLFRSHVIETARKKDDYMIVSYSRKGLQQTGDGHFSPIGGYHEETDKVLILEVARFKYPPHWVSLPALFASMRDYTDSTNNQCRGYMRLTKTVPRGVSMPNVFSVSSRSQAARSLFQFLRSDKLRSTLNAAFTEDVEFSEGIVRFTKMIGLNIGECLQWTIGMEPYTCCDAPDSCRTIKTPATSTKTTEDFGSSDADGEVGMPHQVHMFRRAILSQLQASPLHTHLTQASSTIIDIINSVNSNSPASPSSIPRPDQLLFVSVFFHLVFLMAECQAIALPRKFHVDLSSLGPLLKLELDTLHKHIQSASKR